MKISGVYIVASGLFKEKNEHLFLCNKRNRCDNTRNNESRKHQRQLKIIRVPNKYVQCAQHLWKNNGKKTEENMMMMMMKKKEMEKAEKEKNEQKENIQDKKFQNENGQSS